MKEAADLAVAAATLRTVALAVRTLLRAVFTRALVAATAALFTFAPELALRAARAPLIAAFPFGGRSGFAGRLGATFRFRGGAFRRRAPGRRFSVGLLTALPLLRAPLAGLAVFLVLYAWRASQARVSGTNLWPFGLIGVPRGFAALGAEARMVPQNNPAWNC